jgi:hypothetical protein
METTLAHYHRGADVLARQRPTSVLTRDRPMSPTVSTTAHKYGRSPSPEVHANEHAALNRAPETIRFVMSRSPDQSPSREHEVQLLSAPRSATNASVAPTPPIQSRPQSARPSRQLAPHFAATAVAAADMHSPSSAGTMRDLWSELSSPAGPNRRASVHSSAKGDAAGGWTEHFDHEFTVDELSQCIVAARLRMYQQCDDFVPLADDPIGQLLHPVDAPNRLAEQFVESWRDIAVHGKADVFAKRIATRGGVSRTLAWSIVNEIEGIAMGILEGTLSFDRLEYATRHSCEQAILASAKESLTSTKWGSASEEAWMTFLKLLSK